MLFAHLKAALARLSFDTVVWVRSADMNQRNPHNYLTLVAYPMTNRVLFATPGKDASVWTAFA
jgi:hypothetical protein